jgi:16S rRNA (uracil1498-N3)-methyltransferase
MRILEECKVTRSNARELGGMKRWRGEEIVKVVLWEGEDSRDLKGLLKMSPPTDKFVGMIGPEGGFNRDEIAAAGDAGFISVSLGDRVLRADTAAITMVAVVQYEWGDLNIRHKV